VREVAVALLKNTVLRVEMQEKDGNLSQNGESHVANAD